MNPDHLKHLTCPRFGRPLELGGDLVLEGGRVREGSLVEPVSGTSYSVINFIPRFVPRENYADSFGLEWNTHDRTQYDEQSGFSISRDRFEKETKWGSNLEGQVILEVGSGSGRFTRWALDTGAIVVSFDFSSAVEANYRSNGHHPNLLLVQASAYEMPFARDYFDKAFCFGVLQHTPDPEATFVSMVEHVRQGGWIASDVYAKTLRHWVLGTKYWVRPFTRRQDPGKLYSWVKGHVDTMWPLVRVIRKIPRVGGAINWRLLVADHSRLLPDADDEVLREWAYLDTFDMLSPRYDLPQSLFEFRRWHEELGLTEIDVHYGYNGVEGRAKKSRYHSVTHSGSHASSEDAP